MVLQGVEVSQIIKCSFVPVVQFKWSSSHSSFPVQIPGVRMVLKVIWILLFKSVKINSLLLSPS